MLAGSQNYISRYFISTVVTVAVEATYPSSSRPNCDLLTQLCLQRGALTAVSSVAHVFTDMMVLVFEKKVSYQSFAVVLKATMFYSFISAIFVPLVAVFASSIQNAFGHSPIDTVHNTLNINIPDVTPVMVDSYVCTAKKLNSAESYIVQYEPDANGRNVHHLLLFGCKSLHSQSHLYPGYWKCGGNLCNQMTIMYGWAKNAPAMKLPPNVGFLVGGNSSIQYLVLQVHYSGSFLKSMTDNSGLKIKMTTERQPYITGIHLLLAESALIPPHRPKFHVDVNCRFRGRSPIHIFAYRVHTHSLGTAVSGYSFNLKNNSWTFLSKGNPQWPQAFYPIEEKIVSNDDVLVARCTYSSVRRVHPVQIGSSATDEMCNLYLMYYTEYTGRIEDHSSPCVGVEFTDLAQGLPSGNDQALSLNPFFGKESPSTRSHFSNIAQSSQGKGFSTNLLGLNKNLSVYAEKSVPNSESNDKYLLNHSFMYKASLGWASPDFQFGQISAVTINKQGNPVIFHRGDHVWNEYSFDQYHNYLLASKGAIAASTIIAIDTVSGQILDHWGSNMFYMPHGLHIDSNENYWLTDVALHQVFCFRKADRQKPVLILGEKFVPGNDREHFCKPASAAVSKEGDVYIADGYCNSRIIHFSYDGKFLKQWGKASNYFDSNPPVGTFRIPHKVILLEKKGLICVADRENGRIQCFLRNGSFRFQIQREEFGGTVYSIAYSENNGLLFAVSGEATYKDNPVKAFAFNITDQQMLSELIPPSGTFSRPHDIASSNDAEEVYICEIGPNIVWKFLRDYHKSSKKVLSEDLPETLPTLPTPMNGARLIPAANNPSQSTKFHTSSSSEEPDGAKFETSVVVVSLLGIPVLLMVLIMAIIRLRKRGKLQCFSLGHLKGWLGGYRAPQHNEKFDIGNLLNPHKGFDKVAVEDSEESESESEEFNTTANKA